MRRYLKRRRDHSGSQYTYEIIVVDDGSRDATVRVAFDYVRRHGVDAVRVLQLPRNYGKVRRSSARTPNSTKVPSLPACRVLPHL
jgi:dolichyl-phosphate beta-glucosyltransferase